MERNKPAFVKYSVPDVQDSRFQIHVFSIKADDFTTDYRISLLAKHSGIKAERLGKRH